MGPRFCKRGNEEDDVLYGIWETLQWGHAFVSVETPVSAIPALGLDELQWGHAFVSVETYA